MPMAEPSIKKISDCKYMTTDMVDKVHIEKTEVLNVSDRSIKFRNSIQSVLSDRGEKTSDPFF